MTFWAVFLKNIYIHKKYRDKEGKLFKIVIIISIWGICFALRDLNIIILFIKKKKLYKICNYNLGKHFLLVVPTSVHYMVQWPYAIFDIRHSLEKPASVKCIFLANIIIIYWPGARRGRFYLVETFPQPVATTFCVLRN